MHLAGGEYQALFDDNPIPQFVFDRETLQVVLVNRAACERYGWSRDEFLAMTLRDIRPPSEIPAFESKYGELSRSHNVRNTRGARHRTKDGQILDVTIEMSRITIGGRAAVLAAVIDVTGVAEEERRSRLIVEHSADGFSLANDSGVVVYVSPGGLRMLGHEPDGQLPSMRVHPDDNNTWKKLDPGETRHNLVRVAHADGSWRWIESITTNLTKDPGVRAYVTNYRDVTQRKLAEDALVVSQQRLAFLLSATLAITYTTRLVGDHGVTFISASVSQVLGHEPADFYAEPSFWKDHIHPDDIPLVETELAAIRARDPLPVEYRFRHRDGSYRWMRDVARIMRDDAGTPVEIVGYWADVTDQVSAEASLRRSEANFRALIERTPTATFVHRDGKHVYCNPAAVAMFGVLSAADIVGKPALHFIHPDDRDMISARIRQVEVAGTTGANVCRIVRPDGSIFLFEAEGMRLEFDGQMSNVVMGRDVTERDQMFARIALADRMISVGTLAAGVAHEINNPLAYVAANLETLATELPNIQLAPGSKLQPDVLHSLLEDAQEGVARMSAIVRDLRALSRGENEQQGPVDVVAVLTSAIKMASNEVRHHARIVTSYDPDLPLVQVDAFRLGQVFVNLLLNAAQAIPAGHADLNEITVRCTNDGARVRISVSDSGIGMAPHVVRRIFDPFFTTKAQGAGTGLGLSISHQIVRSMNGEIVVTSEPGRGSTFTVVLPASAQPASTHDESPAETRSVARVLLIDDEAALGRSLTLLLAPETEVIAVTRAADALERIERGEEFDAILCDVMMPEISGIELYDRLVQTTPSYTNRIIFMTGGAFTPEARAFLATTTAPRLDKPFSEAQLRQAIASACARASVT